MQSTQLSQTDTAALLAFFATYWVVGAVFAVLAIVAMWRIFSKAGRAGWTSLVPVYNHYALYKIAFGGAKEFWLVFVTGWLGGFATYLSTNTLTNGSAGYYIAVVVALVLMVICLVYTVKFSFALAKSFGKGTGFGFGLFLLNPIFMLILGFGSAQYVRGTTQNA